MSVGACKLVDITAVNLTAEVFDHKNLLAGYDPESAGDLMTRPNNADGLTQCHGIEGEARPFQLPGDP